jgi:hypothetical protein
LDPPSGSKSVTENIATAKNVHPESDNPTSGKSPELPNDSETSRFPVDIAPQGKLSDAVTYVKAPKSNSASLVSAEIVKDVSESRGVMTDPASESIEVTYTAEQVSHHPPGMLL